MPLELPPLPQKPMSTPFGKVAVLLRLITEEQLNDALLTQVSNEPRLKLGEILIEKNLLSSQQVNMILARQATKAMVCPKCRHKFQIIMYQKTREYQCRHCAERVVLVEDTIQVPAKPKKADLMGLTQEYRAIPRGEVKLDFAPEEPVSTQNILEKAGLHPLVMKDYSKRPTNARHFNYIGLIMIILCLGGIGFGVHKFFFSSKPIKTSINDTPTPPPEDKEQKRREEARARFEELTQLSVDLADQQSIEKQIQLYQEFISAYPIPEYSSQANSKKEELERTLQQITKKKRMYAMLLEAQESLNKKQWQEAENLLDTIAQNLGFLDASKQNEFQSAKEQLLKETASIWQKELANIEALKDRQAYDEALQSLEQDKNNRIVKYQTEAAELAAKLAQERDEFNWIQTAMPVWHRIYPSLQRRNYEAAIKVLEGSASSTPQYKTRWEAWQQQIKATQSYRKMLDQTIAPLKNQKISWTLANNTKLVGTMIKYMPEKDIVYLQTANGPKNILLPSISNKQLVSLHAPPDDNTFSAFVIPWKGVPGIEPWMPKDLSSAEGKQWTLLLAADLDVAIRNLDYKRLEAGLPTFMRHTPTATWKMLHWYLARLIWDSVNRPDVKLTKTNYRNWMQILQTQFPKTEFAGKANEWLSKN